MGRLTRDKGIHELVECFQILRQEKRNVHLLLLGDFEAGDPVDPGTAEWIRTAPHVHWLGYVRNTRPYYEIMSLFVFPTYREGLGKVLLEAQAAGVPVVSTYATGVVDAVHDGLTGILVPTHDARSLARAAGTLLDDAELAKRMGQAGQHLIREHFDSSVYLERFGRMLQSLTQDRPMPAMGDSIRTYR